MKVVIIETGGWGGICHYTYNLANALVKVGIKELIVISGKSYELEDLKRDFRLIKYFDIRRGHLSNISGLINIIVKERPSIIHIQSILSPRKDWVSLLLARLLGIPIIYTVHNIFPHEEEERNAIGLRTTLRIIYRNAEILIAHSEANKKELIKEFDINPERIKVIPHGNYLFLVPEKGINKEEARKKIGLNMSDKVLLTFGAIRKYKGIEYLIKAFKVVKGSVPQARLLIVGIVKNVDLDRYASIVNELKLKDSVLFFPEYIPLDAIGSFFMASDAVTYPYIDTTESGSLQIAYAFSKPVVVTTVGSFPENVVEGKNGFLVPPGDQDALANAIMNLLSLNDEELKRLGEFSRKITEKRHDWLDIAEKTAGVYKELLYQSSV